MRLRAAALRHARLNAGHLVEPYGRPRRHLASPLFRNSSALMLNTGITGLLGFVYWLFVACHCPAADVGRASAAYATIGRTIRHWGRSIEYPVGWCGRPS
jgi:hypothetical protein